jgi:hypothetical protein
MKAFANLIESSSVNQLLVLSDQSLIKKLSKALTIQASLPKISPTL